MSTLQINIYKNQREVEKTYTAQTYDLMLGTVEDLMEIIDFDKLKSREEMTVMIVQCYKLLLPLLYDIFEGITAEDLRKIKVKELVPLFISIIENIVKDLSILPKKN